MTGSKPLTVALFGPTACGKTKTAIEIARRFNGEIINLDSVQMYRGLDVGSAKPTPLELGQAPHHLIDIAEPLQKLSPFEVVEKARDAAKKILSKNRLPVFCGGTGLYFKALFDGLFEGPAAHPEIRKKIRKQALEQGIPFLHQQLKKIDPETADRISENDLVRIERALEVFEATGKTLSAFHREQRYEPDFEFIRIGLNYPRPELYARIESRIDTMIQNGLLEEAAGLFARYPDSLVLSSAIGYKEMKQVLTQQESLLEATVKLKQNTRRFAKRQITLFQSFQNTFWVIPPDTNQILCWLESHLALN